MPKKPKKNKAQNEAVEAQVRANQAEQERARGTPGRQTLQAINGVPVDPRTNRVASDRREEAGLRPSADLRPGTPLILQEAAARGLPTEALGTRDQIAAARLAQNLGLQQEDQAILNERARVEEINNSIPGIQGLQDLAAGNVPALPQATTGGEIQPLNNVGLAITGGGALAAGLGGSSLPLGVGSALAAAGAPAVAVAGVGAGIAGAAYVTKEEIQKVKNYNTQTQGLPKRLAQINNYVNGGGDPQVALQMFDELVADSLQIEANLHAQTMNSVTEFLSGSGDEEIRIKTFNAGLPSYALTLQNNILNPDTTKITDVSIYDREQ